MISCCVVHKFLQNIGTLSNKQHHVTHDVRWLTNYTITTIYRVEQEECARLREGVPYVRVERYNPKHLYPKLNGLGDNGQ